MREGHYANSCFLYEVSQASCIQDDGHNASLSICRAKMACRHYALQMYAKNFNYQNFWGHISMNLDKICLNYARNNDFMPYSQ